MQTGRAKALSGVSLAVIPLAVLMLLGIPGCRPVTGSDDSPDGLTSRADAAFEGGDPSEALELYDRALELYPDHALEAEWYLGRGRALLALGRRAEAMEAAGQAISASPDAATTASARLLMARSAISGGSVTDGIRMLAELDRESLGRDEADEAVDLLREALATVSTDWLTGEPADDWTEVFVLLELERRYAEAGDVQRATLTGMEIDRLYPGAHDRYGRPEMPEATETPFVALVLPFTGSGSEYAESVSRGVELAFLRRMDLVGSPPELTSFDFEGDSATLAGMVATLGDNPSCMAVIGPLTSRLVHVAAPVASSKRLPLLSPTATSPEIDDYGSYVHRLVISEGNGAAAVAEHAVREDGHHRFAIIHEYSSESVGAADQFRSVVTELGAEVVSTQGYESGTTDFRDQISAIRYLGVDAVFLPVTAWDAIQIAPQLRFYSVEADLYGTAGWDDEILVEQGGEYVEGAVFPVAFGAGSMNPATARFAYFYEREYDEQPVVLAAQGYDAAEMVLDAWSGTIPSRRSLESHLRDIDVYFGATGMCTVGGSSVPRSAYPLVEVHDGEIISVE